MSGTRSTKAKGPWVGLNPAVDLDIKVAASATDTTPDFLFPKMAVAGNLTKTLLNGGGNEQVQIADSATPQYTFVYLGPATTDGTWRISQSGTDLIFERRESGNYIQKGAITP